MPTGARLRRSPPPAIGGDSTQPRWEPHRELAVASSPVLLPAWTCASLPAVAGVTQSGRVYAPAIPRIMSVPAL
jgi:hypothetical protein